jgi:predicted regulator of Ras-like GTPase activity (Roadblock/LC7/MglB family)
MNSSMLALAETLAKESSQQLCRFVILENSDGRIVSLRVNDILLLTCVSNQDSNLGYVLNTGQSAAIDLAEIF